MTAAALLIMLAVLVIVAMVVRHEYQSIEWPDCHYDAELRRCIEKLEDEIQKKR